MNILVTGANGQLGLELRNLAAKSVHRYIFSDICNLPGLETLFLDITNPAAVRIVAEAEAVDAIVNCAAYTNVDKAESDCANAELLNATAAGQLAVLCKERNALLVHISTDYIYGGNVNRPLKEESEPQPEGVYGATKLAGERLIRQSGCRHLILRTAWLYSPYGKNFLKTMWRLTAEKKSLKVVYDQLGSPTCAGDLAAAIFRILEEGLYDRTGTYNYTNEGAVSRYDFARAICELSGHNCDILPCLTEEYPTRARRPAYSVLDKARIRKTFGITPPYWRTSLKQCIERMDALKQPEDKG